MLDFSQIKPIDYFNEWFAEPIDLRDDTVLGHIEALTRHPSADDQTAQDYVMPIRRCREHANRFRVWGENQDTYYCFVLDGDESKPNPPVYFESCLDLVSDYGLDPSSIIDGDRVLVAEQFPDFVWHMLGHHICLRYESGNQFKSSVSGILTRDANVNATFSRPSQLEFPAGYSPLFALDTILIPDWGAAFLSQQSRQSFIREFSPTINAEWAEA